MTAEHSLLLSSSRPSGPQVRLCVFVAAALTIASIAIAPFGDVQLERIDGFIPVVDTILLMSDMITASLLLAQFSVQRSLALLVLAMGYFFAGLIIIPHALTFPGAFSETGLLGAGLNTTIWLYYFWHLSLPLAVIVYALLRARGGPGVDASRIRGATVASACGVLILASNLTVLATVGHDWLPTMMPDAMNWTPARVNVVASMLVALLVVALTLLWRLPRSVLDIWLLVTLWAWLIELIMVIFTSSRFSGLWFAGRLFGLLSGLFVLLMLVWETNRIYARLALVALSREREREARLMSMRAVTSAIEHEIRQPLGAIVASANAGRRWLDRSPPDVAAGLASLEAISAAGHRAADVVRSVRSLFGKEDDTPPLALDPNEVVAQSVGLIREELRLLRIEVQLDLTPGLPSVTAHASQLRQVILNLVSNAADAMRGLADRDAVLKIASRSNETEGVELTVSDCGTGIDPSIRDRIFDPHFTTKPHGMGMGLAICRLVVESHGGSLTMAPGVPHGTVFRVSLPGVS